MNVFADAFAWIFSPDRLTDNIPLADLIVQHLFYTFISVLIAAAIASENVTAEDFAARLTCWPLAFSSVSRNL